jgi:hypothetical protein
MSKFIGRRVNIGIGKETVRGVYGVAASYWLPHMDISCDDRINFVVDDTSLNVIEDAQSQDITSKYMEGSMSGRVNDTSFGLILLATLGTEVKSSVGGETLVFDHAFTLAESSQHQSLCIMTNDPNQTGASSIKYNLAMIDTLELNAEINAYLTYKVDFRGNTAATSNQTPSYPAPENIFLPQVGTVSIASTYGGLPGTTAQIKKFNLSIKKNIEDDIIIGNVSPIDRLNKKFEVTGQMELMYEDRSYIDTILLGDLAKAMRVAFVNTTTIGSTSNPTLTVDLARVKITEVGRNIKNNDLVTQTVKFKAFYSISDALMLKMTLRNLLASTY